MKHNNRSRAGKERIRAELPYGMWTCADGTQVLFNRAYCPIWERTQHGKARATGWRWVHYIEQQWLYDDGNSPTFYSPMIATCEAVLDAFLTGELIPVKPFLDHVERRRIHDERWDRAKAA